MLFAFHSYGIKVMLVTNLSFIDIFEIYWSKSVVLNTKNAIQNTEHFENAHATHQVEWLITDAPANIFFVEASCQR